MIWENSLKFNLLSFEELVINLDRLSRFKLPEESFPRVFYSVILKHLISPKYSKNSLYDEDINVICKIFKEIWNKSVSACCGSSTADCNSSRILKLLNDIFINMDKRTEAMMNTDFNITTVLKKINYDKAPINLKFLIKTMNTSEKLSCEQIREKYSLCFPLSKLLIVEGITEEILLPVFADKLNKNFNKNGVYVLGAGGKSKSPSLYMKFKNRLKIPIILLFDEDARKICADLNDNMLKKDKYLLIEHGEFEDILPLNLIKRTLNNEYMPATPLALNDLRQSQKMCENIENFYKSRHLGEFKKSKFAKIIAENIKYNTDITDEIKKIINCVI